MSIANILIGRYEVVGLKFLRPLRGTRKECLVYYNLLSSKNCQESSDYPNNYDELQYNVIEIMEDI